MLVYLLDGEARRAPFLPLVPRSEQPKLGRPGTLLLGASEAGAPLGVLLLAAEDGVFDLRWLYVARRARRRGVASALLRRLLAALEEDALASGVTAVLAEDSLPEALLTGCGFTLSPAPEGAALWKATVAELGVIPRFRRPARPGAAVLPPAQLPRAVLNAFFAGPGRAAPLPRPFSARAYTPESAVYLADGQIRGLLLVAGGAEVLSIPWAYAAPGYPGALPALLDHVTPAIRAAYPPETPVAFTTLGAPSGAIARKLLPGGSAKKLTLAEYRVGDQTEESNSHA